MAQKLWHDVVVARRRGWRQRRRRRRRCNVQKILLRRTRASAYYCVHVCWYVRTRVRSACDTRMLYDYYYVRRRQNNTTETHSEKK